jgi:hypothetical protein
LSLGGGLDGTEGLGCFVFHNETTLNLALGLAREKMKSRKLFSENSSC